MFAINRSALRTLDVLNLVATSRQPLTITEISQQLELPKTSTFDIVYSLLDKEYLEVSDGRLKTFQLGIQAFKTGMTYLEKTSLHSAAQAQLEHMMQEAKETAFLAISKDNRIVYLSKVEAPATVRTDSWLGSTNPMHCTGLGKALLAAYSIERVNEIIASEGMLPKTKYSLQTPEQLFNDLERIRKRGYSIDCRESEVEVFCVAAPIYNHLNKPIAAISLAGMASRFIGDQNHIDFCGNLVKRTALTLSGKLGYGGNALYLDC